MTDLCPSCNEPVDRFPGDGCAAMTLHPIDWEAEMEALDASLPERLERAAQMAERSDIWTDTERLMPATGVADLLWEAHSEILGWRALNEERKASRTCPLGEDCDLTVAWMAGRESAKDEYKARIAAALEEAREEGRREERKACAKIAEDAFTDFEGKGVFIYGIDVAERIRERGDCARAAELKEDQ